MSEMNESGEKPKVGVFKRTLMVLKWLLVMAVFAGLVVAIYFGAIWVRDYKGLKGRPEHAQRQQQQQPEFKPGQPASGDHDQEQDIENAKTPPPPPMMPDKPCQGPGTDRVIFQDNHGTIIINFGPGMQPAPVQKAPCSTKSAPKQKQIAPTAKQDCLAPLWQSVTCWADVPAPYISVGTKKEWSIEAGQVVGIRVAHGYKVIFDETSNCFDIIGRTDTGWVRWERGVNCGKMFFEYRIRPKDQRATLRFTAQNRQ